METFTEMLETTEDFEISLKNESVALAKPLVELMTVS